MAFPKLKNELQRLSELSRFGFRQAHAKTARVADVSVAAEHAFGPQKDKDSHINNNALGELPAADTGTCSQISFRERSSTYYVTQFFEDTTPPSTRPRVTRRNVYLYPTLPTSNEISQSVNLLRILLQRFSKNISF